jgi:two-component system sensor histidine kinase AgrC
MMLLELLFKIAVLSTMIALLTPMKYSVKKSAVIIIALQLLIWMANYLCYAYISKPLIALFQFFTIGIPGFFCFNVVAKYKGFRVLFTLLTVSIFSMFCDFIGNLNLPSGIVLHNIIKYGSFVLVMIFMVKVFKKPYFKILQTLERGWALLCLIPFCLINIICLLQYYPTPLSERPQNLPIVIAAFVVTFVFYAIFYINFENISQLFQLKRDRDVLAVQTDMYQKQYESMMDNIQSMKIYRHDMKHHLSAINTLLGNGPVSEAKKYISSLDQSLNDTVVDSYCENYVVNVILSSYIRKAQNEQIEIECEAEIPDDIPIDSIELGLVFANALDNAITACRRIESVSARRITIACKPYCEQIFIRITNPFTGEVKFDGEYPVSESAEHGAGTRSIAAIAKKYSGIFSFTAQDGIFKTTLALKYS